jgi:hypothetical protein
MRDDFRFNLKEEITWTATERSYACKCGGSKAVNASTPVSEAKDVIWTILYSTNKLHVLANLMVTIKFGFDEALPILLPCEIHSFFLTHPVHIRNRASKFSNHSLHLSSINSKTFMRVSSDSGVNHYIVSIKLVRLFFSACDANQNRHTGNVVKHTGIFF